MPDILSLHQGMSAGGGNYESFFSAVDKQQSGVRSLVELRDKLVAKVS